MGQKFAAFDTQGNITAFYDSIDSPPPDGADVVSISDDEWRQLIDGMSHGKRASLGDNRRPVLVDMPPPTRDAVASTMRSKRDSAMTATDWLVSRHQDEKLLGNGTSLTSEQFSTLLRYRQSLRDVSTADGWPYIDLPVVPVFVADLS
ncbi:TPA: phage tail protein [Burkholderia vietnamiensis]|nr:phage tail protein [Burkholderia vietnamiensis]